MEQTGFIATVQENVAKCLEIQCSVCFLKPLLRVPPHAFYDGLTVSESVYSILSNNFNDRDFR